MERDRSNDENQNDAGRLQLYEEEEGNNRDQMAADGAQEENIADANEGSSPSICKLDIDCCEELFEYLPLEDLHSLGQTCKKMHQFTGYFVRENHKSTEFEWKNGNLFKRWSEKNYNMNGFIEFISCLTIWSDQLERFAEFAPSFKSVRKVSLILNGDQIDCIKEILYKCEKIDIRFDRTMLTFDIYDKILKFCTNLKHFELNPYDWPYASNENINWLLHEYPNLESLDLYSDSYAEQSIPEIKTFFTLNKGIRKFQTTLLFFWNCWQWIVDTDIKLDELSVVFLCEALNIEHTNLLNTLYDQGIYKHLSLLKIRYHDSSILAKIRAPLTMELEMCRSPLPPLDLKEFKCLSTDIIDLETILANNFSSIECVHFHSLKTESILFFVRNFIELREIKIDFLDDVNSFNLVTLNEEECDDLFKQN